MIIMKDVLKDFPLITLYAGDRLLGQGEKTNSLYFLHEGSVRIMKDGCMVGLSSDQGAVFGEMSIMLGSEHSATVECVEDSRFYHIKNPRSYLDTHPEVIWHIAEILSRRIYNLNQYFVNLKGHYEKPDKDDTVTQKDYAERTKMINEALNILQIQ